MVETHYFDKTVKIRVFSIKNTPYFHTSRIVTWRSLPTAWKPDGFQYAMF